MAGGHGVDDDPSLKGISRYFNSQTNRGRANVSEMYCSLPTHYLCPELGDTRIRIRIRII